MDAQRKDRSKNAASVPRNQLRAVLLSVALTSVPIALVNGADRLEPVSQQPPSNTPSSPVIKSVGIKFVADRNSAPTPASTIPESSPPVSMSVPMAVSNSIDAGQASKSNGGGQEPVKLNAIVTPPSITMPPMLAGSTTEKAELEAPPIQAVKLEMLPPPKTLSKVMMAVPGVAELPKSDVEKPLAALGSALQPTAETVSSADRNPSHNPTVANPIAMPKLTIGTLSSSSSSPKDTLKGLATARLTELDKFSKPEPSRAPNVVRIPSMTLGKTAQADPPTAESRSSVAQPARAMTRVVPVSLPKAVDSPALEQRPEPRLKNLPVVAIPVSEVTETIRNDIQMDQSPQPQSTEDNDIQPLVPPSPASQAMVEVIHRDVHSITLDGTVDHIAVDDESICKAMLSNSNEILLLGVGRGTTRLQVWMSGAAANQPPKTIDVAVRETWTAASLHDESTIAKVTNSIAELFPTARIAIRSYENGSLTVFGKTDSEDQAKQIASLVRKMFLVPVQDRIAVSSP